eukprot:362234-Chlamydomonas_euryale.AAC.6
MRLRGRYGGGERPQAAGGARSARSGSCLPLDMRQISKSSVQAPRPSLLVHACMYAVYLVHACGHPI